MAGDMETPPPVTTSPILHVVVVGFHHIKGYQLEYAYPPLIEGGTLDSQELPEPWKHLPSLALPDGAHNYEEDTIYFHLPALDNPKQSIFGISCYRQINAEKLLRREADVTRSSVQKSVCVLSRLPLFGLIQAKLQLVTHAYFEERDFSKVSLLQETFQNLNSLLCPEMLQGSSTFLGNISFPGLSSRDLILHFKHKAVLLFKLFLLERKVLFYKTPVKDLCSTILTLCSLFPGWQEDSTGEPVSPLLSSKEQHSTEDLSLLSRTIRNSETKSLAKRAESIEAPTEDTMLFSHKASSEEKAERPAEKPAAESVRLSLGSVGKEIFSKILPAGLADMAHLSRTSADDAVFEQEDKLVSEIEELLDSDPKDKAEMRQPCRVDEGLTALVVDVVQEGTEDGFFYFSLNLLRAPGSLCLPYVSLPIIDLLSDISVRSCVVGATNDLFKQKKHLFDVIVEVDECKINILDNDLRRQLYLTMEDLRFADYLVKNVLDDSKDIFLDTTCWQGGEEWLRAQFKIYLVSLLRTAQLEGSNSKDQEAFNTAFLSAWKTTHNFKIWNSVAHPCLKDIPTG
uniref:UDENN domain-containing protein n=1 Tax=Ixodes scapularis TaxID=6945 RepID=A0A1S4L6Q1_IXOSC